VADRSLLTLPCYDRRVLLGVRLRTGADVSLQPGRLKNLKGMKPSSSVPLGGALFALTAVVIATGCFYPPEQRPPTPDQSSIIIARPFDLVWNAAHEVIAANGYHLIAEDPNSGLIETQASGGFTLKDADCGKLRSMATKYDAEPDIDATVVYNFTVRPSGDEASSVAVQATFMAPLEVPLRPTAGIQCVSRGLQETRLLKQIAAQAAKEQRPHFAG